MAYSLYQQSNRVIVVSHHRLRRPDAGFGSFGVIIGQAHHDEVGKPCAGIFAIEVFAVLPQLAQEYLDFLGVANFVGVRVLRTYMPDQPLRARRRLHRRSCADP